MARRVEKVEAAIAPVVNRAHIADGKIGGFEIELVDFTASECRSRNRKIGGAWAENADFIPGPTMRAVEGGKVDGSPIWF